MQNVPLSTLFLVALMCLLPVHSGAGEPVQWKPEIVRLAEMAGKLDLMGNAPLGTPRPEHVELGRYVLVLEKFVASGSPHSEKLRLFLARALKRQGMREECFKHAEALLKSQYDSVEATALLPDGAVRLGRSFPRNWKYGHAPIEIVAVRFEALRKYRAALDPEYKELFGVDPKSWGPPAFPSFSTLQEIALLYARMGEAKEALHCYNWMIALWGRMIRGENLLRPYWEMGQLFEQMGNWDQALNSYLKCIAERAFRTQDQIDAATTKAIEMCARIGADERIVSLRPAIDQRQLSLIADIWRTDCCYDLALATYDRIERQFGSDMSEEKAGTLEQWADMLLSAACDEVFFVWGEVVTKEKIQTLYDHALKLFEKVGKAKGKADAYAGKLSRLPKLIDFLPPTFDPAKQPGPPKSPLSPPASDKSP